MAVYNDGTRYGLSTPLGTHTEVDELGIYGLTPDKYTRSVLPGSSTFVSETVSAPTYAVESAATVVYTKDSL